MISPSALPLRESIASVDSNWRRVNSSFCGFSWRNLIYNLSKLPTQTSCLVLLKLCQASSILWMSLSSPIWARTWANRQLSKLSESSYLDVKPAMTLQAKSKKPTLPANVPQPYPFLVLEAIWSKVDASSGWQSELCRALAKKVKSTKEFAIACDPDFKVGFEQISEEGISLVSLW